MIRIEIIIDSIIEDVFMEALEKEENLQHFTHITSVKGQGFHEPKRGDAIWPGENSIMIFYTPEENRDKFMTLVKDIRKKNPGNGVAMFILQGAEVV